MKIINKPVEIICTHDRNGKIMPFRMRISEDSSFNVYNLEVINKDERKVDKNTTIKNFYCKFIDNDILRNCEIYYKIQETTWMLYKLG